MAQPRPPRGRQPTDEPGWWLASDGRWYPPESAPEPVIESLPPISWHAPGYAPLPEPTSTSTNVGPPAVLVAEGNVAAHGSAPVTPETPPTTKPPEAAEEPARLWPKVAIAAALMLLIAAIGTVYSTQRDDRDATTVSAPKKHSAPVTTTTERTTATTGPTTTTTTTTTTTLPSPPPTEAPTVAAPVPLAAPAPAATYYANCDAVRAAGAAPIYRGQPGYAPHLDRDGDGVGCE